MTGNETGHSVARRASLTGIFAIVAAAAIYHGRSLLAPIAVAVLLKFLLAPAVRGLRRAGVPNGIGAALVIAASVSAVGGASYALAGPVGAWLERAPRSVDELEARVKKWRPTIERFAATADKVSNAARPSGGAVSVRVEDRPPLERAIATTWPALVNTLVVIILLYFLLAGGDVLVAKLVESLPRFEDKKTSVKVVRELEQTISRYLVTITAINAALGAVIAGVCYLAGLPDPLLWGAMAALFNYVPFVGALAGAMIVGLASASTFGPTASALIAPGLYLLISGLEGYLITPSILGRNLSLSPVAVFVSMLFWGWAWGLIGVLIAVPMLMIARISLGVSERTRPLAGFLGSG